MLPAGAGPHRGRWRTVLPSAVWAGGRCRIDRRSLLDAGPALLLLAVILGVATVYVAGAEFFKSPRAAWRMITGSLRSEYNAPHTIPSLLLASRRFSQRSARGCSPADGGHAGSG